MHLPPALNFQSFMQRAFCVVLSASHESGDVNGIKQFTCPFAHIPEFQHRADEQRSLDVTLADRWVIHDPDTDQVQPSMPGPAATARGTVETVANLIWLTTDWVRRGACRPAARVRY